MSTQVQYRRGSNVQVAAFTGALGEIVVDTTNKILVVSDGTTVGGFPQVGLTATQTLTNKVYNGTSVSVSGNVVGGNVTTVGLISATGNITGGNIITSGLISITGASQAASYSASGNITGGNILSNGQLSIVGNVVQSAANSFIAYSYAQSLTATGSTQATAYVITATNNQFTTVASGTGAILPAGLPGQIVFVANDSATNALLIYPPSGGYIDQAAANAAISISALGMWMGTALGSNVWTTISPDTFGTANQITVTQGNGIVTLALASSPSVSGNITGGNLTTAGQVSATGNITGGGLVGTLYTNSIINTGANATGNIGSSSLYFNTVFAKATSAQYADVAEWYASDQHYEPGTVVIFGGEAEVTVAYKIGDNRVAGVVSTNPAYIMNAGIQSEHAVPVALTGRVPTQVIGPVRKGNMMVSAGNGRAMACATPAVGTVIGKAIENFDGQHGIIEIVVGRV